MIKECIKAYKAVRKYEKELKRCKQYREKYVLINNGKEIIETFNSNLLPNFNSYKDPYISEKLKFMRLITDLDVVNQNLIESHNIWQKISNAKDQLYKEVTIYNTYLYKRINKLHEYIVYDLKHFVDEVIATVSIIKGATMNNKVYVSSIGAYLAKKNMDYIEFNQFFDLFDKLDDLSNSYKHSYANSDLSVIGKDEDCFVALYSKYNDFNNQPIPYVISVNYIVEEFNKFYKYSFELIDKLTKEEL